MRLGRVQGRAARLVLAALPLFGAIGCARGEGAGTPSAALASSNDAATAEVADAAVGGPAYIEPAIVQAPPEPPTCQDASDVHLFVSPSVPTVGVPLRVLAVTDKPLSGELAIVREGKPARTKKGDESPAAMVVSKSDVRRGGPPYFWIAEVPAATGGGYTARLQQSACEEGTNVVRRKIGISRAARSEPPPPQEGDGLWPSRSTWSHHLENVYSAWIEALFDAPDGEMPSWSALHELLRDPKRNLLFDHLAQGEDSTNAPVVRPDCADLPYFLRAYFAFKLKLPFGVSECNRGGSGAPPTCKDTLVTNEDPPPKFDPAATPVKVFGNFLRGSLADRAHSGSGRIPFDDENSDYYPVPLGWNSLRPGTVFADPYGHVLVVAKRLPQTAERGGVLLAVDGQPDGTVARKRFWRGNFLYAEGRELGGPGFKRFRPLSRKDGQLIRWDDEAIRKSAEYNDLSREPAKLGTEAFYDVMDDVMSPSPLDPERAMLETVAALEEQVRTRVKSVDNGRKWLATAKEAAPMPEGSEIFETTGTWEDFSTPSRDLRILIAMDVVAGFPARVARRPTRYAMPKGKSPRDVQADLERTLARELSGRTITYQRSDGSPFTLTLEQVLARAPALEMAYNPNDCVEMRWGAPAGSDEARTCNAQAPADQRERMNQAKAWFHDRRRPARK